MAEETLQEMEERLKKEAEDEKRQLKEALLTQYVPLFEQAENGKLWFYNSMNNVWFSPRELREMHDLGRYIWPLEAWELLDPNEELLKYKTMITTAQRLIEIWKKRMREEGADVTVS